MSDRTQRLAAARRRLVEQVSDPFAGLAIRTIVPEGLVVMPCIPDESIGEAVSRAARLSAGTPLFLAVDEAGPEMMPILVVEPGTRPGAYVIRLYGNDRPTATPVAATDPVSVALDKLRGA